MRQFELEKKIMRKREKENDKEPLSLMITVNGTSEGAIIGKEGF